MSCHRSGSRKTLKYRQSRDLEGIQLILWVYTDAAPGRRYLVSKIQDGSQPAESSNISETKKHIIKIPMATTMFWGSTFLVVVPTISWDVDVC